MVSFAAGIYLVAVFGVCTALPIQAVVNSDRNIILLGFLAFLSVGVVVAGCVCCRRRKKGFEEFNNECGTLEANKTEYPIFRVLSPDSQRQNSVAEPVAISNSNENLIEEDFDNNNGPISSADLENIENNNAENYIQHQNEVIVTIESSPYSINRNLAGSSSASLEISQCNLQDVAVVTSISECLKQTSLQNVQADLDSVLINSVKMSQENSVILENELGEPMVVRNNQLKSVLPGIHLIDETKANLKNTVHTNLHRVQENSENTFAGDNCHENVKELPTIDRNNSCTPYETVSNNSNTSAVSNEIISVDEALRALDFAIDGENSPNSGYEDDLGDEEFTYDYSNFHNVIRELLISNGLDNSSTDFSKEEAIRNKEIAKKDIEDDIRAKAEFLVDSIISESQRIVNEEIENSETLSNPVCNTNTVIVYNCNISNHFPEALYNTQTYDKDAEVLEVTPIMSPCQSSESMFMLEDVQKTSTPCVRTKHLSHKNPDLITCALPQIQYSKKLLDMNSDVGMIPIEIEDSPEASSNTFVPLNTLENNLNENNGTDNEELCNETFNVNKTFEVLVPAEEYVHPCDPCTSKQAMERDNCFPCILYECEEANSEDMATVTPVNTPIELNYPKEMWKKLINNSELVDENSEDRTSDEVNCGWFLHPQDSNVNENESKTFDATFDIEEDKENLEFTLESLRKQLAEVLPQPQGIMGPVDYSDEDNVQQRTFDDPLLALLACDSTSGTVAQNELYINYKRALTPILEESEEETCKTFVMNDTKCMESTRSSTDCIDTGEAMMGVSRALMASNDTLFNFEDTLGDGEEIYSSITPSRSETNTNISNTSGKSTEDNSVETLNSEHVDLNCSEKCVVREKGESRGGRSPPKTLDLLPSEQFITANDMCSPEQQKTFSEETNSSNTDRLSSDMSGTVGHDITFTTNTHDEKTCITVIVKDDERISEISEPEWGSTTSYGFGYELNSLTDIPSLDGNVKDIEEECERNESLSSTASENTNLEINPSHNSTERQFELKSKKGKNVAPISVNSFTIESNLKAEHEAENCDNINSTNDLITNTSHSSKHKLIQFEELGNFLQKEIEFSSSQMSCFFYKGEVNMGLSEEGDLNNSKENTNPNSQQSTISSNSLVETNKLSYEKVQTNNRSAVIAAKSNCNATDKNTNDLTNEVHGNILYDSEITVPSKHVPTVINYWVSNVNSGRHNEQYFLTTSDEVVGCLPGEKDSWDGPLENDASLTAQCQEILPVMTNEWDSDVDDSHSSDEFMYLRGTQTKQEISEMVDSFSDNVKNGVEHIFKYQHDLQGIDMWVTHEDKVPIKDLTKDGISEESSSDVEGEFVPSYWDSMALPVRSALRSPDKSSSQLNKKRRSVAFKKQRYHSVYEYPRENISLSPSLSEPHLLKKHNDYLSYGRDCREEFMDGFAVSSTMRPFHGSQFSSLCHTWPTDSDFSWSQIEEFSETTSDKEFINFSNGQRKWAKKCDSIEMDDSDEKLENCKNYGNIRPDSGVGISAEMLSDNAPAGELCHVKSTLRLPLDYLPSVDFLLEKQEPSKRDMCTDRLILPTPSCTGSMDSISSSSESDRQIIFSTFGKNTNLTNGKHNEIPKMSTSALINTNEHPKPTVILIESGPVEFSLGLDKIKQGDSTDEDSGIESIMKINKRIC